MPLPHTTTPATVDLTALQRHVAFFDRNGDGRVTVAEVVDTLQMLGCSNAYAYVNALGGMLARTTEPGVASHDVVVANAHRGKYRDAELHGETRIFDKLGQFDAVRFDEVMDRYGQSGVDGLTEADIGAMITDISHSGSVERSSAELAFRLLMTIAGEVLPSGDLVVTRARLRAFYEGDLLPSLLATRRRVTNAEPIGTTAMDVAVGAVRAICPFRHSVVTSNS